MLGPAGNRSMKLGGRGRRISILYTASVIVEREGRALVNLITRQVSRSFVFLKRGDRIARSLGFRRSGRVGLVRGRPAAGRHPVATRRDKSPGGKQ